MSAPDMPKADVATVSLAGDTIILSLGVEQQKVEFVLTTGAAAILALTLHPTLQVLHSRLPKRDGTVGVPDTPEGL